MADIEGISRVGKELSITWKGFTDIFVIEEAEIAGTIFEKIPQTSTEQRRTLEEREVEKKQSSEVYNVLNPTIEIINSLFDILRSLHGWVDWNSVEGFLNRSELDSMRLTDKQIKRLQLDFAKLSLAIKARLSEDTLKEANSLLGSLYNYFSGLARFG